MEQKSSTRTASVDGLRDRRNPVTILHRTHTDRVKVRDQYGYELRVDPDRVEER